MKWRSQRNALVWRCTYMALYFMRWLGQPVKLLVMVLSHYSSWLRQWMWQFGAAP
jgi:hypothetical protein